MRRIGEDGGQLDPLPSFFLLLLRERRIASLVQNNELRHKLLWGSDAERTLLKVDDGAPSDFAKYDRLWGTRLLGWFRGHLHPFVKGWCTYEQAVL